MHGIGSPTKPESININSYSTKQKALLDGSAFVNTTFNSVSKVI